MAIDLSRHSTLWLEKWIRTLKSEQELHLVPEGYADAYADVINAYQSEVDRRNKVSDILRDNPAAPPETEG